jgi:glycosyltransferase involved in cell wall biosynthesis
MMRLLISRTTQFGYHTDTYWYCKYFGRDWDVTHVCWDYGLKRIEEEDVRVLYVSRKGRKVKRLLRYLFTVLNEIKTHTYDVVFLGYFQGCSLLRCIQHRQLMVLDIRTGYVGKRGSSTQRKANNLLIHIESRFFKYITIISDNLRRDLRLNPDKCHILPCGAERQDFGEKKFDAMRLLYVGAFNHRDIPATVDGFGRFFRDMKGKISMSYDIVGFGCSEEERAIVDAILRSGCEELIRFHGRIPRTELGPLLKKNNIGVAFIPMEDHYQSQPASKLFEYLLAGMPVLATRTKENTRIVNNVNGVLINDDSTAFYEGLMRFYGNLAGYDSRRIAEESKVYSWDEIIGGNLRHYVVNLIR